MEEDKNEMMIDTSASNAHATIKEEPNEDDWEDAETEIIVVDYSRIQELVTKMNKEGKSTKTKLQNSNSS
jgi:hypothetical protein